MRDVRSSVVSGLRRRGVVLGLYAAAVAMVPLGTMGWPSRDDPGIDPRVVAPTMRERPAAAEPAAALRQLQGLWSRYEPGGEGERVRFYYFHGDGKGLYRYGRVGLSNTHSFDYEVRDGQLVLDFRKTGEHHEVRFTLDPGEPGASRDALTLHDDPREAGPTRYVRQPAAGSAMEASASPRLAPEASASEASASDGPAPAGRMWIDLRDYATGGRGFTMYQLRPAGIDGRGTGWFHRGDFDDWSTEAMTYRIVGDRLELHFTIADERGATTFGVETDAEGSRWLALDDDPRDFWHAHRYLDMGPSFGAALAPFEALSRR